MPDGDVLALNRLGRLGRVLGWLDAAPAPLDEAGLAQAVRLVSRLWSDLFTGETGTACAAMRPTVVEAAAVFVPCPSPRDRAAYRAWHGAQAGLFLHYGPVAGRLLDPAGRADERATALLITDAMRLLAHHAAGLGRPCGHYATVATPAAPFAHLVQRTDRLRSGASSDVNLGAVALGLAIESGMRHVLGLPGKARLSMWRLFRALAEAAPEVRLTVDLTVIVAIYNWAGRHRRAGCRDYGWLNYYAADLLHPLFVPPEPFDAGFGLEAGPETLAWLRDAAAGSGRVESVTALPERLGIALPAMCPEGELAAVA